MYLRFPVTFDRVKIAENKLHHYVRFVNALLECNMTLNSTTGQIFQLIFKVMFVMTIPFDLTRLEEQVVFFIFCLDDKLYTNHALSIGRYIVSLAFDRF